MSDTFFTRSKLTISILTRYTRVGCFIVILAANRTFRSHCAHSIYNKKYINFVIKIKEIQTTIYGTVFTGY
jgi:hypothetical protein